MSHADHNFAPSLFKEFTKLNSCKCPRFSEFTSHNPNKINTKPQVRHGVTITFVITHSVELIGKAGSALQGSRIESKALFWSQILRPLIE